MTTPKSTISLPKSCLEEYATRWPEGQVRVEEDGIMWRTLLVLLAIVFSASMVHGAPMVLRELSYSDGGQQFMQLPTSLPFRFSIYEPHVFPTPVYASWTENYSPADIGKSFFAPPEVVAGANAGRGSPTALVVLEVNEGSFHSTPAPWWPFFTGNYVTAIERVVDNLVITPISQNRYTTQFAHRVRIWGEPIPEPSAIALMVLAATYGCITCRVTVGRH